MVSLSGLFSAFLVVVNLVRRLVSMQLIVTVGNAPSPRGEHVAFLEGFPFTGLAISPLERLPNDGGANRKKVSLMCGMQLVSSSLTHG
jgi:hypothetical protein